MLLGTGGKGTLQDQADLRAGLSPSVPGSGRVADGLGIYLRVFLRKLQEV